MGTWWDRRVDPERGADMVAKYDALAGLASLDEGLRRDPIRRIARRWPAALREAELVGPERCVDRRALAARVAREPARSARSWHAAGAGAVVLWAALHPLIGDVARARLILRAPMDPHEFIRATRPIDRSRWTEPDRLEALLGGRISTRSAYLWLAHQAALDLPRLNFLLFERRGSWDRRPGDPDWAHARPDESEIG